MVAICTMSRALILLVPTSVFIMHSSFCSLPLTVTTEQRFLLLKEQLLKNRNYTDLYNCEVGKNYSHKIDKREAT